MVDKPAGQEHTLNAKVILQKEQVVACNHDAQLLFDCEREEILGHSLLAFSPPQQPDGRQSLEVLRQRTVAALSHEPQQFTWVVRQPTGGTVAAEAHLQPIKARGRTLAQLTLQVPMPADTQPELESESAPAEGARVQSTSSEQVVEAGAPPSPVEADLVALPADEPQAEPAEVATEEQQAASQTAVESGPVEQAEAEPWPEEAQSPEATTEERPAPDPASEQLRHFKMGIERSNDAIFMTDVDGTITYVNPGFEQVYGYTADEAVGRTPRILKSGVLTKSVYEAFWQTLLAKEVVSGEIINRSKDGRLLHIEGTNSPILDEDEELIGFLGIHRDVTERKRAEEALREARDQLEERVVERTQELTDANLQLLERNAELERIRQELEQRNRILETLRDLTQQTTASEPNIVPIFEATVNMMADVVEATSARLLEIDESQGTATVVAEYFAPKATTVECQPAIGAIFNMAEDFTDARRALVDQARPYVLRLDDPDLDPGDRIFLEQNDAKAVLGLPLAAHGRPMGEITLWDSGRVRSFSDDEIDLLQSIASQVAVPIENARLYAQTLRELDERRELEQRIQESLEQRTRQVRLSTQLSRQIAEAPDLNDLYERVVTQVKEQFGFYHVQLLRYEPVLEAVVLMAGYGQTGQLMKEQGHRMAMGQGLIGQAAKSGRPVLRPNVSHDPDWRPNPLLPETRAELAVPIMLGDEVLGVLDVQSNEVDGLTTDDQLILEGLCAQIAIAIEETRLRQEMADQLGELERLQGIMSREGWLSYQAQRRGRLGYRFTESSLLHPVTDEELDTTESERQQHQQELISAPMRVRGQVIGALGIEGDADHPLTPEERELVDSISEQVAEALESARLLQQTQKHAIEMEAVAQVSAAASTILDAPKLLQTVANLSKERFDLHHVSVFVLEDDTLQWAAGTTLPPSAAGHPGPRSVALEAPNSAVAKAARLREPIVIDDLSQTEDHAIQALVPAARAELAIPLVVGGQTLGVLDLLADTAGRFSEDDVRIHTTLGAQVAVAFQNANLYERQLETATRLREVDRLKSQFLASMSHELRTPLNSIIGFADVLLEGIDGPLNERMSEDVTLIRDSGRHLRALISEMLDMSKIEAGMMELRYEPINVSLLAKEVMANTKSLALGKELELNLELDPNLDTVEADRTRLTQILLNLLSNAVKFTKKGEVTLAMREENGELKVTVADTGIGISDEDMPKLFEQFRQIDDSMTRQAGGTGLGLPISKSLVELHGGEMWVESQLEQGSKFHFTIPKTREDDSHSPALGPPSQRANGGPQLPD